MNTKPDPHNRLSELARLDAIDAARWPPRIARALRTIDDHRSPLHASTGRQCGDEAPILMESPDMTAAKVDRAELRRLILERDKLARGIGTILNRWAPGHIEANAGVWCENHTAHGHNEPRAKNRRHCWWCIDIEQRIGKLPNRRLIELHSRGVKISDTLARSTVDQPKRKGAA